MFFNLKHFKCKEVCWSFEMKLGQIHKRNFKMKSTCIIKKRGNQCKSNENDVANLVGTTSNISFT
jgi:hypothetical protein